MIGVFVITLFSGCASNEPIAQECLDYFKSLENQKYWSQQSTETKIEDASNGSISPFINESKKEWYLKFYNLDIILKDKTGAPLKATIKATVLDTKTDKEITYQLLVNESNEESLKNVLAKSATDEQRNSRVYNSIMAEVKKLIAEGKLDLAMQKIGDARSYEDTDEAESLLDSLYYKQGESLYKNKDYEQAKGKLSYIHYDKNWIKKAQDLINAIDAQKKVELTRVRNTLRKSRDEFKEATFYEHYLDLEGMWGFFLFPYIGVDNNHKWYFLRLHMYSADWLFADKIYAIVGDNKYETPVYDMFNDNVTQEVVSGGVYERIDFKGSDFQVNELVRAVVNAPLGTRIKFRVEGKNDYFDFAMSRENHQAWKDIMYFYDNGV